MPQVAKLTGIQPLPSRSSGSATIPVELRENLEISSSGTRAPAPGTSLEQLKNRPVFILIWAPGLTSPALDLSLTAVGLLRDEFKHRGVGFLGMVLPVGQSQVADAGSGVFEFEVISDRDGRSMKELGVSSLPTALYLDRSLRLTAVKDGILDVESARVLLESLVSERTE